MQPANVRYTNLDAPESNGCDGCLALKNLRAFCEQHRGDRPCTWCLGKGHTVKEYRWSPCTCQARHDNEKERN